MTDERLSDYQRGYLDGFDAPANIEARTFCDGIHYDVAGQRVCHPETQETPAVAKYRRGLREKVQRISNPEGDAHFELAIARVLALLGEPNDD